MNDQSTTTPIDPELDALTQFQGPIYLLKKALSSIGIMLAIGAGLLLNWGMALVFLISGLGSVIWWQYLLGLVFFIALFPGLYVFFAVDYGKNVVFWEAYRQIIRPFLGKSFGFVLDRFLIENPEAATKPIEENRIVAAVEQRKKHFLEKLPDFMRAYVQIFFTSGDIIHIVRAQRQSGEEKEAVKKKSMVSFFESLDLQVAELLEPSFIPALIVAVVNIGVAYWLF